MPFRNAEDLEGPLERFLRKPGPTRSRRHELRDRPTVLQDRKDLARLGYLVEDGQALGLELRSVDRLHNDQSE